MDKMLRVHQRKTTKQPKIKKKPVKVVYISNPMKVKTSASQFRALVQELTGQDADMLDPSKIMDIESVGGVPGQEEEEEVVLPYEIKAVEDQLKVTTRAPAAKVQHHPHELSTRSESDLSFETFDEDAMFMPQLLVNFPSGLVSSGNSWFHEPSHAEELKSLDAM